MLRKIPHAQRNRLEIDNRSRACLSVCLFVCLSVCLFVCLSVCLFVCLSVCLFVCLSVLNGCVPLHRGDAIAIWLPLPHPACNLVRR